MPIAAVILAAGASSRFGARKQEVRIGGRTMLEHVAATAADAGLEPMIAVVPPDLAVPDGVVASINDAPAAGMGRSIRLGLASVPDEADGAVVLLGDEPGLDPAVIRATLLEADGGARIVATRHGERVGPPVFLPRSRFAIADDLEGDDGLGGLLRRRDDVRLVELATAPIDVDTLDDLDRVAPACPGCGARLLAQPGAPTHAYIGASAGCWSRWSELMATTGIGGLGRHANDAYAAQHPGVDGRRQRQSVAVHLIALCHWLEHDITDPRLTQLTRAALGGRPDWAWLSPPPTYALTVHDLPVPATPADGRHWAESVWDAWRDHHDTVRRWAADLLDR